MQAFTKLEREILASLSAHISQNDEISLTDLAKECHVAKSTVVKAIKKLGYKGFDELTHSIRLNARAGDGVLLPRQVVQGRSQETVVTLAHQLLLCEQKRNFIFSGDRRTGRLIASYMSRKLAMFDIFAPASYDYALARQESLPCGTAFFCFHKELPGRSPLGQQEGYGDGMLRSARDAGFSLVVFSDDVERERPAKADLLVRISGNEDDREDLYVSKVLIVFERALSLYATERRARDAAVRA